VPRSSSVPARAGSGPADDARLADVERAFTRLMRQATQPRLYRRLAAAGGVNLDRAAYATLVRVEEAGAARLTDLAEATGVDISTVSRQVRALESQGLTERQCDPADQRAFRIGLTPAGREVVDRARRARRQAIGDLLSAWTAEEQERLATLLGRLADEIASSAHDLDLEAAR